jgi:hypothetical protein
VVWTGLIVSGYGPVEGSCEHDNETSGSIKYLENACNWRLLKNNLTPWNYVVLLHGRQHNKFQVRV